MIKSKFVKTLILCVCLTVGSSGVVYANDILDKHREVDQYVFEQHKDEISQQGFNVTHTGPFDDYVEIGIAPYNEENAEYLYNIFGKDKVKVIQGEQAVTLGLAPTDKGVASEVKAPVATSDQSGTKLGRTSILGSLGYILGAVIVLGVAGIALKRVIPIGKK